MCKTPQQKVHFRGPSRMFTEHRPVIWDCFVNVANWVNVVPFSGEFSRKVINFFGKALRFCQETLKTYVIIISEYTYIDQPTTNTNHLQSSHTKLIVCELTPAYKQCAHLYPGFIVTRLFEGFITIYARISIIVRVERVVKQLQFCSFFQIAGLLK